MVVRQSIGSPSLRDVSHESKALLDAEVGLPRPVRGRGRQRAGVVLVGSRTESRADVVVRHPGRRSEQRRADVPGPRCGGPCRWGLSRGREARCAVRGRAGGAAVPALLPGGRPLRAAVPQPGAARQPGAGPAGRPGARAGRAVPVPGRSAVRGRGLAGAGLGPADRGARFPGRAGPGRCPVRPPPPRRWNRSGGASTEPAGPGPSTACRFGRFPSRNARRVAR